MSEDKKTLSSKILRSQFRFVAEQICRPTENSGATKIERGGELLKSSAQVDPLVAPGDRSLGKAEAAEQGAAPRFSALRGYPTGV